MQRRHGGVRVAVLSVLLVLTACGGGGGQESTGGGTFVFGASADPVSLDGAFVFDAESIRVIYQIAETLVTTKPGSLELAPQLAESWEASPDGRAWTFELRTGVRFHDGTRFDAEAVCFNFERWYHFTGVQQSDSVARGWKTIFGGFSDKPETSLYESCEAIDADTVVIRLTRPSASFVATLVMSPFSIASPTALRRYEADRVSGTGEAPAFEGSYGLGHPTGTGPFEFESFTPNDKVVLVRNERYWGDKASLERVIVRPIPDAAARRQALEAGELDAYDNPDPGDIEALRANGFRVLERPAFNVGYLGFNQSMPPLDDLKVRQAIAHALNRSALIRAKYPGGAEVATQFQPRDLIGWSPDVPTYDYDPARARRLLAESGVREPTLEFWYPTGVSRGYMPDPAANFQAFKADLEAVGFRVEPKPAPWAPDYLSTLNNGRAQVFLIGLLGDFADPDNFIGVLFQRPMTRFGFRDPALSTALDAAEAELDPKTRARLYREANALIMQILPGVPYVHTGTFVALAEDVVSYVPSPTTVEPFSTVRLG